MKNMDLIIVTGMSGAGKTLSSRYLEDMGYFCVDNLPPVIIPKFVELCNHSTEHMQKFVLVIDARSREYFDTFGQILDNLDKEDISYKLLFMDASDEIIIRRYKETRRRHPINAEVPLSTAIAEERLLLSKIKARADYVIDTTNLKAIKLKEQITEIFEGNSQTMHMKLNILSFGFKFGMPLDADLVFDVRFLPNPFYDEKLRHKSGTVLEVSQYIEQFEVTHEFLKYLDQFINFLVPQYRKEGKAQLVIAIGCTGGMHRSVYVANHLKQLLASEGEQVYLQHRDLMKNDVEEHVET